VVKARIDELMLAQQEVAFAHNHRRVGQACEVVVDGREGGRWLARSHGEAPEIDPRVLLSDPSPPRGAGPELAGLREIELLPAAGPRVAPGAFLEARITGTRGYDLLAEPLRADGERPRAATR
jgi:tRNA A37 methylthiotransferase MiaB